MKTKYVGIVGAVLVAAALVLGTFGTVLAQTADPDGTGWGPGGTGGWCPGFGRIGWNMGPGSVREWCPGFERSGWSVGRGAAPFEAGR